MAYITTYSYKKLCRTIKVNIDISLAFFIEHIFNDRNIYFILTKHEIKSLFIFKMIFLDEQDFVINHYQEVPEREDSQMFVFDKGGKIKYHLYDDCHLLKNDYLDFSIPKEIRELGKDMIDEYRNWFIVNDFMGKYKSGTIDKNTIIGIFNMKYPPKYGIKPIEDDSNLLIMDIPNSTNNTIDRSFDVEEFKRKIQDLKNRWYNIYTCNVHRILAKQRYLFDKDENEIRQRMTTLFSENFTDNFGMSNLKEKIGISREIANELLKLLEEYIKWSYSLDVESKDFDVLILEQFGLTCCNSCANRVDKH